mmetsp:Transcript_94846/g.217114  ORF Transcript_94846/g.217114 Transcript_94846/m.217114 type:complete len:349 (+) Transcript_94846:244-1290(+)
MDPQAGPMGGVVGAGDDGLRPHALPGVKHGVAGFRLVSGAVGVEDPGDDAVLAPTAAPNRAASPGTPKTTPSRMIAGSSWPGTHTCVIGRTDGGGAFGITAQTPSPPPRLGGAFGGTSAACTATRPDPGGARPRRPPRGLHPGISSSSGSVMSSCKANGDGTHRGTNTGAVGRIGDTPAGDGKAVASPWVSLASSDQSSGKSAQSDAGAERVVELLPVWGEAGSQVAKSTTTGSSLSKASVESSASGSLPGSCPSHSRPRPRRGLFRRRPAHAARPGTTGPTSTPAPGSLLSTRKAPVDARTSREAPAGWLNRTITAVAPLPASTDTLRTSPYRRKSSHSWLSGPALP